MPTVPQQLYFTPKRKNLQLRGKILILNLQQKKTQIINLAEGKKKII